MRHDVFISYSEEDKLAAGTICQALEAAGIRCWIAPRDIQEGEDWTAAIMCGIAQCRAMVLIFSRHANLSSHVYREVGHAFNHGLTVIPFRIEDIEAEEKLLYYLGSVAVAERFSSAGGGIPLPLGCRGQQPIGKDSYSRNRVLQYRLGTEGSDCGAIAWLCRRR